MQKDLRKYYRRSRRFVRRCMLFALRRIIWPVFYYLGCLRKIDPKLILFVNDLEEKASDNFIPVMDRLTAEGYRCVHISKRQGSQIRKFLQILHFYFFIYPKAHSIFLVEVCRLIDNCTPRKGTEIIQLWHGCGAFKKWGYSTVDLDWGPSRTVWKWFPTHRFYTHACVSAPEVIPHYAEAFNCSESVIHPWGAPRTDYYFRPGITEECRRQVLEAFPDIGGRKIVVYAPTFRGNSMKKARHDDVLDYSAMAEKLGERCALLLKPHPRSNSTIPSPEPGQAPFVFDATALPIEVLLCAADLVISDYSSLVFEYALLGRPMLFYAYDLEEYENSRSFYYPYLSFVPGDLVWDTEDVISGIRGNLFEGRFDPARVEAFREKFMSACDGHSTERILKNILGI